MSMKRKPRRMWAAEFSRGKAYELRCWKTRADRKEMLSWVVNRPTWKLLRVEVCEVRRKP